MEIQKEFTLFGIRVQEQEYENVCYSNRKSMLKDIVLRAIDEKKEQVIMASETDVILRLQSEVKLLKSMLECLTKAR